MKMEKITLHVLFFYISWELLVLKLHLTSLRYTLKQALNEKVFLN